MPTQRFNAIKYGITIALSIGVLFTANSAIAKSSAKSGASAKGKTAGGPRQMDLAFRERLFRGNVTADDSAGERALLAGKYDDSAAAFRKALAKNKNDAAAHTGLGFALAYGFKLEGADKEFDTALNLNSKDPLAHVGKAFVHMANLQSSNMTILKQRKEQLAAAEGECNNALSIDPGMPEAELVLGMVKKEQGDQAGAIDHFSKAISGDAKFDAAYTRRGLSYADQGSMPQAEDDFKKAISLRSGNAAAHYGLGRVYTSQGKLDEAYRELNTALSLNHNSAPIQIAMGDVAAKQGNVVKALQSYNKAVSIRAENTDAYMRIADIYQDRGDLEAALLDLRNGLMLNPDSEALHARIADVNLQLEKFDNAIKEYNAALDLNPGDAQAVKGLTRTYMLKSQKEASGAFFLDNNFEDAEQHLQKAIQMNPNDLELRLADAKLRAMSGKPVDLRQIGTPTNDAERVAYAEALLAQFKYAEATQEMMTVINHTNDVKQLFALGDLSQLIHDYQSAQAAYSKAASSPNPQAQSRAKRSMAQINKSKQDALKSLHLGQDLAKRKQYTSGIDNYRNAAYLDPRLPDAHLGLAEALKKDYEKDPARLREAAAQFRAYVSLMPTLPEKEREKYQKTAEKCEEKAFSLEKKRTNG